MASMDAGAGSRWGSGSTPDGLPALVGGGRQQVGEAVRAGEAIEARRAQGPGLVHVAAADRLGDEHRVRQLDELQQRMHTRTFGPVHNGVWMSKGTPCSGRPHASMVGCGDGAWSQTKRQHHCSR